MEYTVLWFDDEHETFETLINRALRNGIKLVGVSNSDEGLELLKTNPDHYDAVILDGLFFSSSEDSLDNVSEDAFANVAKFLNENKHKYLIPWFIYSGQPSFVKDKNTLVNVFGESFGLKQVYDKNEREDEDQLWEDIKKAADNIERTRVRKTYSDTFQIFKNGFLDYESEKTLIDLHLKISDGHKFDQPKNEFTKLRKIIEKLIKESDSRDLIPRDIDSSNLAKAVKFMCGKDSDFPLNENHFHPLINYIFPHLLDILQDGSHAKKDLRCKADEYALEIGNGYLFKSCLFQLQDVLIAFNKLFLKNKKGLISLPNWKEAQLKIYHEGFLSKDSYGNYHCGDYVFNSRHIEGKIEEGEKIRILGITENRDPKHKRFYSKFVYKFEVI